MVVAAIRRTSTPHPRQRAPPRGPLPTGKPGARPFTTFSMPPGAGCDASHRSKPSSATRSGAILVDIRSEAQRCRDGQIPGAVCHPRNVLEWRADPASEHSDPALSADLSRCVILVCDEGYQSSLAAATLKDLGFPNATDVIGGFQAWRAAGLAVVAPGTL